MNTKLTTITTQYSKFSDNQVLTKGQLNQFLEYFEDQDHLSRIGLSGVGIVCGFDLTYDGSKKEIYISQGYGVTTDGDLVALIEPKKAIEGQATSQGLQLVQDAIKTYTHYRNFDDSNAMYAPFFSGEEQIELLEIFPREDIDLTNTTYTQLNTLSQAVLDDKVALLYLENYPKQGDLCTALDCDNQGIEQVARLRVLLVSSDDAKTITGYDPIYNEHDWHEYYLALPEIAVRRDILTEENTKDYIRLKQNYYNLIKDNETLADLSLGLDVIFQKFGRVAISSNITSLFDISPSAVPDDFQYHYDVLKDLVDTYTEIKGLLLHLNVHCCPSIGSFPKHLLLGRLKESQPHYKSLRHRFYKSPIIGHEDANLKRVHSLLNRVEEIVESYIKLEKGEDIKITPSLLQGMLGTKAIPFYYELNQAFLNHWSYDKFQNLIQTSNLSYHRTLLSPSLSIQEPLLYDIDDYDFLRIEGIQGKSYRDALDQVLQLKKDYGLSFDVKVLSLNPTTKDIDLGEYRCEFEDLSVLLKAWTTEQECILASMANFFSGFTTDKVGENIKEIEYTQGRKKITKEINPDIEVDTPIEEVVTRDTSRIDAQRILVKNKQISVNKKIQLPYSKNVIDESLTVEDKTIGRYMKEAIEENKKGSVNDIKNATRSKLEEFLSTDEWVAQPDIRDFVYNDVVDLLSVTYILSERIPRSISEIDTGNIDTYELTLEEVCQLVKRLKVTYQTIDLEDTLKDILGLLINQLSFVCCSGEKLTILLEEIEKRKEEILTQLQLSEYVKKHPGLRHYAGVPIGGTFVMAYLTENAEDKVAYQPVRLELNFLEQPNIDDDGTDGDEGIIKLWDRRISTRFAFLHKVTDGTQNPRNEIVMIGDSLQKTVSNLADFLNNIWRVAGLSHKCKATTNQTTLTIELLDQNIRKRENFIQFYNPAIVNTNNKIFFDENEIIIRNVTAKNTVIADFALPYMCCSDCAPVNFIVPKEPVSLSLPTPFICLDDSTTPIPFTVSPIDGEVKAIVEGEISGGVTQNEEGAYVFDATLLDPSLYGTAIRFTVNDEETIAVITVYQNPQPVVTVSEENFNYNEARTQVEVFFEVTGTGLNENSVFAWDFGDGTPIVQERPNSDSIVSHIYTLPIDPNNTVFPRLTVTNELCANEVILEGIVFQNPVEVSLEIQNTYCLDAQGEATVEIPFSNISPEGGLIEIVGGDDDGMFINQDTPSLVITPGVFNRFDEPIAFTISSLPTTAQIIISQILQINISEDSGSFFWDDGVLKRNYFFNAQLPDEVDADSLSYEWHINEIPVGTDRFFEHAFTLIEQDTDNQFNVTLFVTDTNGCIATATTLVNIPYPLFSIALEMNSYCTDDPESYEITVSPNFSGTEIDGLGVTKNTDGTFTFTPVNTGVLTSQSIDLRIVGTTETTTINLNSGPVPNFTVEITDGRLIIENISDVGTAPYVWNIAGEEIIRQNRTGFDIDVFSFEESVITISLTVNGECGPNTLVREDITIRGDINFSLELPDGVLDYCNNDETPYPITITPSIPGTIVEGDGVSQTVDGNFVFTPANSGVTSSGNVALSINGDILLTVQIQEPQNIVIVQVPNPPITRPQNSQDITLTASPNIPGATYNWTFGDGTIATGVSITKTFTVPVGFEGQFPISVDLNVSGTICTLQPVSGEVVITVNSPDFTLELNGGNHDFCDNDGFQYPITITPNIPNTEVEGTGVQPNGNGGFVFRPSAAGAGLRNLSINGETLLTANVLEAPIADFTFSPANPSITRPNNSRTISFTAVGANAIVQRFPSAVFNWRFIDSNTGQTLQEGQGSSTSATFSVPPQAQGSYAITARLTISGTLCDPAPRPKPVVILINEEVVEPSDCNEIVGSAINADADTIKTDPIPDGEVGDFVIRPTKQAYETVSTELSKYIAGDNNGQLNSLLSATIEETANRLLQESKPDAIQLFTKYLRVQIRLIIHILHCQKELNDQDIEMLNPIMNTIKTALERLQNTQFDVGDPEPDKLEGTLREFLMQCLENESLSEYTKLRIQEYLNLIAPIG
ncbi:hypothetical protein ACFO3O_14455 [Dokdonia ponticola]|uniref:PKD domain-containing protein n=1 Tax=Dokdonia ponticola TaxID=2041041 RepID=A0ABV9HZY6_9FLAO